MSFYSFGRAHQNTSNLLIARLMALEVFVLILSFLFTWIPRIQYTCHVPSCRCAIFLVDNRHDNFRTQEFLRARGAHRQNSYVVSSEDSFHCNGPFSITSSYSHRFVWSNNRWIELVELY